jgi:uncharacterized protein YbaA (DUF1428 family)
MAQEAAKVWKEHGALDYKECIIENIKPSDEITLTFPKLINTKPNETVWFSFIVYESKAQRDKINKKVMDYFNKKYENNKMEMPFDMNRFVFGGFNVEVEG